MRFFILAFLVQFLINSSSSQKADIQNYKEAAIEYPDSVNVETADESNYSLDATFGIFRNSYMNEARYYSGPATGLNASVLNVYGTFGIGAGVSFVYNEKLIEYQGFTNQNKDRFNTNIGLLFGNVFSSMRYLFSYELIYQGFRKKTTGPTRDPIPSSFFGKSMGMQVGIPIVFKKSKKRDLLNKSVKSKDALGINLWTNIKYYDHRLKEASGLVISIGCSFRNTSTFSQK